MVARLKRQPSMMLAWFNSSEMTTSSLLRTAETVPAFAANPLWKTTTASTFLNSASRRSSSMWIAMVPIMLLMWALVAVVLGTFVVVLNQTIVNVALPSIRGAMGEELDKGGWIVSDDMSIERGGCRIDTPSNQIDAQVQARWTRLAHAVGKNLEWLEQE